MSFTLPAARRHAAQLAAAFATAATVAAVAAPSASAASLLRPIGFAPDGTPASGLTPIAVSNDGTEVLGEFVPGNHTFEWPQADLIQPYVYNVVTQKVTRILSQNESIRGASADLQRVLFDTSASFSPKDTNDQSDLYLFDRATGAKTLISRDPATGLAIGSVPDPDDSNAPYLQGNGGAQISGNGKVVYVATFTHPHGAAAYTDTLWRYDVAADSFTKVAGAAGVFANSASSDDAGNVFMTTNGVDAGGKRFDVSLDRFYNIVVSPDGGTVAAEKDFNQIAALNTKTGTVGTVAAPDWLPSYWQLKAIANGGSSAIIEAPTQGSAPKIQFGRIDDRGNVSQLGVDMPQTSDTQYIQPVVSQNGLFAADGLHLMALGSTPVPGADPSTPSAAKASDYLQLGDATCKKFSIFASAITYNRPALSLTTAARGVEFRTPVKATYKAFKTTTGAVTNQGTLNAGQSVELLTGITGNYTVTATVTFNDGSTLNGSQVVAAHARPACGIDNF